MWLAVHSCNMLKRPSATDTEEDLLAFQESFLASGSKPAASVAARSRVGEKRKQLQQEDRSEERERDVVQLQSEELPSIDAAKPPAKKSKFKVQREKSKEKNEQGFKDPFEAMERHDRHITKVLSDIQEHDSFSLPVCLPTRLTKHGFPTVHELDLKATSKAEDATEGLSGRKKQAKQSLFAQQFESHGPEYFGLELQTQAHVAETSVRRDVVEPVKLGVPRRREEEDTTSWSEESNQTWLKQSEKAVGKVVGEESLQEGMEVDCTPAQGRSEGGTHGLPSSLGRHPGGKGDPLVREKFASEASRTWGRYLQSGVISGEGLMSVGVAPEEAQEEVGKIHQENVERLSRLSEGEILEEQDRIRQLLGPDLVSFLQSRHAKQKMRGGEEGEERGGRDDGSGNTEEKEGNETQGGITASLEDEGGKGDGEELEREEMNPVRWSAGEEHNQKDIGAPHGWLRMEVLEKDKMQWMTDVPLHPQPGEGLASKEVRFSLEGLVIPRGAVIPPHLGLHHHGDEPEAAGYTLNELLHLSRSRVLQQRVLSLQTLARIIQRSHQNEYGCLVEVSVLGILLEAGVPTMLRYSLDDSADTIMAATILCLHGLLMVPLEEYLMDKYCCCHHGNTLPALRSHDLSHDLKEKKQEKEEEESDAEVIQRDVVEGYLQMKLPHRLRYILEVCCPPSNTTVLILEILTRLCRHSVLTASKVLHCPRLMTVVFEEFLPLAWSEDQDSALAHGRPHVAAMKLVQTICTAGRNLTAHLVSQHKLMAVVTRYTLLHPSELSLKEEEAYDLCIASLRTWSVVLGYGIGADVMRDTYAVFVKQLQLMASSTLSSLSQGEVGRVATLLGLVETAIHVAATTPDMLRIEGEEGNIQLPPPALTWSHATGMLTPLLHCLSRWMEESAITQQFSWILCVGSLLHCLASYYTKIASKLPTNPVDMLQQVEAIAGVLDKCTESSLLSALQTLREKSRLANPQLPSDGESYTSSLPTHLTLPPPPKPPIYGRPTMQPDDFHKMVEPRVTSFSCADFLLGYMRLCLAAANVHKGVTNKVTTVFSKAVFRSYLESVVQRPVNKHSCFEFGELELLYCTVKLFTKWLDLTKEDEGGVGEKMRQLCHHLTFKLLSLLPPGMEHYVHDLLSSVVFHPMLQCDPASSILDKYINTLSLKDSPHPITTPLSTPSPSTPALLTESHTLLPSFQGVYLQAVERAGICSKQRLSKSRAWLLGYPLATETQQLPPHCSPLLPLDWPLLPIIMEYNNSVRSDSVTVEPSGDVVGMVTHSLHFLLLLELLRPHVLSELPPGSRLARIMCTFLIGSDLFLERRVRSCLSALLAVYCREEVQRSLDFDLPIPGLDSFQDLYTSLLSQYMAVSYGDALFSCFLLLPLQQRFAPQLRKVVWGDHPSIPRLLTLPVTQVPLKVENFLHPLETDETLLEMYMTAIGTRNVRPERNPFLYLVAVHHIHSFIFKQSEVPASFTPLQKKLLQGVLQFKDQDSQKHLLLYSGPDEESRLGFRVASTLAGFQRSRVLALLQDTGKPPDIPGLL